jgi:hypothetical protein
MISTHAMLRMQQRGIPPFVEELLDEYGERCFDGFGGVVVYFSKVSLRRMERTMGREPVRLLAKYHRYAKVESSHDSTVITVKPSTAAFAADEFGKGRPRGLVINFRRLPSAPTIV